MELKYLFVTFWTHGTIFCFAVTVFGLFCAALQRFDDGKLLRENPAGGLTTATEHHDSEKKSEKGQNGKLQGHVDMPKSIWGFDLLRRKKISIVLARVYFGSGQIQFVVVVGRSQVQVMTGHILDAGLYFRHFPFCISCSSFLQFQTFIYHLCLNQKSWNKVPRTINMLSKWGRMCFV